MNGPTPITFSFGENWQAFLRTMPADALARALADSQHWLSNQQVAGKSIADLGCGSGLHSLVFLQRGAARIHSLDSDPRSVTATRGLWEQAGRPAQWTVDAGSVLDAALIGRLGSEQFDIVYSWGVLHHTGAMWQAIDHACSLVKPGGLLWISLYAKGPQYAYDLALKQRYNAASAFGKRMLAWRFVLRVMYARLRRVRNPFAWNEGKARGMDTWHDIVDWLGGLPYEVASVEEVVAVVGARGFSLKQVEPAPEGSCHVFLFQADVVVGR